MEQTPRQVEPKRSMQKHMFYSTQAYICPSCKLALQYTRSDAGEYYKHPDEDYSGDRRLGLPVNCSLVGKLFEIPFVELKEVELVLRDK